MLAHGRLGGVVNNAGISTRGTIEDTGVQLFDRIISVNARAPFFLMQQCVEDMRKRKSPGAIVNVLDMAYEEGRVDEANRRP